MRNPVFRFIIWLYAQAGMVATLSGCSFAAVVAAVSGCLARQTAWITLHGPIAWWGVVVFSACTGLSMAIAVAHLRYKMATASAINKWKDEVNSINPLEKEFSKKRINVHDIVSPITGRISGIM